ncbi:unnamed protein product [Vitrella brassicaformis CCMP3155]|uniref:Uncharacterized protein n=1 Tax=Vitrella brassicaformis (strain CCMP3155) TaxID=1169540 RepID=A0A0G4FFQ7_VITBC|nr:unnamed protein product [Vitrella brassicaformis CCMP3155]|eukprot:CEM12016.1 unnamed protein product [Vitrella brassicaformis CCMP3155]
MAEVARTSTAYGEVLKTDPVVILQNAAFISYLLADAVALILLAIDGLSPCGSPLALWVMVELFLSAPATMAVDVVNDMPAIATKHAFQLELGWLVVSVLWVFVGTGWVTSSLTCQTTAPALWWLVFTVSMFYWVFLSVFVIAILVFTVVNMLAGQK